MTNVSASGAGPDSLYPVCTNRIETSSLDAPLHESTGLMNELQSSIDFNIEVGDPMDLGTPSEHALSARMVARMRKRPITTIPVEASVKPLSQTTKAQSSLPYFGMKYRDQKPSTQRRRMQARLHPSNRFMVQTWPVSLIQARK